MKIQRIAIACLAVAALAACSKEFNPETGKVMTMSVSREVPGEGTKAALNGTTVEFLAGDEISIFDGVSNNKFTTAAGGATATFTGTAAAAEKYVVVSPYNEDVTVTGSVVRYTIPEVQTAVKGGVDPKALVSAGVTADPTNVKLFNAVSLVKVVVPEGLSVKNIQVAGGYAQNIAICGQFDFNANDDSQTIAVVANKTYPVVTLVPEAGKTFIEPGTYYIAVRPKSTYDGGLTAAFVNENNELCKRQTRTVADIQRSHIFPIGTLNATDYAPVKGTAVLRFYGDSPQFTGRAKSLAAGTVVAPTADDNIITKIVFKAHTLYDAAAKNDGANGVVASFGSVSTVQMHAFMRGTVLYVCTEAPCITLNAGSANLFRNFKALKEVVFDDVDAQANTSFEYMFRNSTAIEKVDFGNPDFSNVNNMSFMFLDCAALKDVNFGKTSTGKVANFKAMFQGCTWMQNLVLGPNFAVTHLTDASMVNNMFNETARLSNGAAGDDPEAKCHLYMAQEQYDNLRASGGTGVFANSQLNPARFYFVPVTAE